MNLLLVQIDPNQYMRSEGMSSDITPSELRTPIAIADNIYALSVYCKETFGKTIGRPNSDTEIYYLVEKTNIVTL